MLNIVIIWTGRKWSKPSRYWRLATLSVMYPDPGLVRSDELPMEMLSEDKLLWKKAWSRIKQDSNVSSGFLSCHLSITKEAGIG